MSSSAQAQTSGAEKKIRACRVRPWRLGRRIKLVEGHRAAAGEGHSRDCRAAAFEHPRGDVATVKRAIALQDGPVVLAGHSYGGAVITEAGTDPKVAGLVYVAAFAPDSGESVGSVGQAYAPAPLGAELRPDAEGYLSISPKGFAEDFAQDLPANEAKVLWAAQGPTNAAVFGATISNAAWRSKPSWFVVAADDRAIPPALEKAAAEKMKATTITLAASHLVMISHPKEVADLIEKAAAHVAKH